ncbi:MAG: hypothetical protein GXP59_10585 [Deltaproteobacteria bacterium]|nr:hypothetical protein [Deltaproteobacteria bacterium]
MDQLTLRMFMKILLRHSLKIVICTVVGLVLALGTTYLLTPQWEVSGLVQYRNQDNVSNRANKVSNRTNDDNNELIARLRTPLMMRSILKDIHLQVTKNNYNKLKKNISLTKVGALVEISVRWDDYDKAIFIAKKMLASVQERDIKNAAPLVDMTKKDILRFAKLKDKMFDTKSNNELSQIGMASLSKPIFNQLLLEEYYKLIYLSENKLRIVTPFSGSPAPVFPDRLLFSALGFLFGLAFALIWVFSSCDIVPYCHQE